MKRLLVVLSVLAACSSSSDLEPQDGAWNYGGSNLASNSCGGPVPTDAAGGFTLTTNADGSLTIVDGDFELPFECTLDGDAYTCPNRAAGSSKIANIDATLFYEVSITGDFSSETALTGTQVVKLRCEGASCTLAATAEGYTLPCEYSFTFDATAQ